MGKIEIDHTGSGGGITLSSDGTDLLLDGNAIGGGALTIENKTSAYTVVSGDLGKILNYTSGTEDVTLTALSSLTTGFYVSIWNSGTGVISIKPNGADGIGVSAGNDYDSSDPLKLQRGTGVTLVNSGTYWQIYSEKAYDYYHHSVTLGANAEVSNNFAMALGNRSSASSVGAIAIGTGQGHATTASNTHAVAIGISTASGANSTALGESYASGTDSFAAAIANNTSSYGATNTNAVAIGSLAKASGSFNSLALSTSQALASGQGSIAVGDTVTASGLKSIAIGQSVTASATGSVVIGRYAKSDIQNKFVYTGDFVGAIGDAQFGLFVLNRGTTNDTPTQVTTNGSAASTDNQIILPNNSAYAFHGTIVAREQASAGTDCAAWKIEGLIRREANAGTTVLVNSATTVIDNTPSWGLALSADTTNGGLKIEVTGAAATNIRWVATIHTSEVTY